MRFSHVVMAYFVIGTMMWAGGAIAWGDAGIASVFVSEPTEGTAGINEDTASQLEQTQGPIEEAVSSVGGGALLAILGVVLALVNFMFWPMAVLIQNGAPAQVWVTLGGIPTVAFYGSFIRLVRTSG